MINIDQEKLHELLFMITLHNRDADVEQTEVQNVVTLVEFTRTSPYQPIVI